MERKGNGSVRGKLIERLDNIFSEYIRLRDSKNGLFKCISCGRILPYNEADCGHYIQRQHMSLRYDERNCNAQCRDCNQFNGGNLSKYRDGLTAKYGESIVKELELKKNCVTRVYDFELREKIAYYRAEVKALKK